MTRAKTQRAQVPAKDWPQLNFIIYHSAYRFAGGGRLEQGWEQLERTGRVAWVNDLAEIPAQYGVKNVYGDLEQIFAQGTMADLRVCAFMMGSLIKERGADHVCWGSDAVWTGSPQWQIEALRRPSLATASSTDESDKRAGVSLYPRLPNLKNSLKSKGLRKSKMKSSPPATLFS